MGINAKFINLRVKLRQNSKRIMDAVLQRHVPNISLKDKSNKEICVFCASENNLTKEHVMPKWVFENCTKRFFITDINESTQTYNKTTIPACADCNNNLLGNIEKYIVSILETINLSSTFFNQEEIQNIIRWLEIIEYKFQLLEIRRKFLKSKKLENSSYFRNIPISIMRANIDYSPHKAVSQIRVAQKRVTTKSKINNENSLVVFKTKNESFYFFHHLNGFIFLELPKYKIALFYFYSKEFENNEIAKDEAMKIITSVYES